MEKGGGGRRRNRTSCIEWQGINQNRKRDGESRRSILAQMRSEGGRLRDPAEDRFCTSEHSFCGSVQYY